MQTWLVDVFVDRSAGYLGNPAGVVVCADGARDGFPSVDRMQAAAHESGLPTLAFVIPLTTTRYRIRWFTPLSELNICGHATVASACYLYEMTEVDDGEPLTFLTNHGPLHTRGRDGDIAVDLPVMPTTEIEPPPGLARALGADIVRCERAVDDIMVEVGSADEVAKLEPDFAALAQVGCRGHVVTARANPGDGLDFVSRTFFPALGVNEDQVCVSAHCKLAPYWAARLGRDELRTVQLSERGGRLSVRLAGDRVQVAGQAVVRGRVKDAV